MKKFTKLLLVLLFGAPSCIKTGDRATYVMNRARTTRFLADTEVNLTAVRVEDQVLWYRALVYAAPILGDPVNEEYSGKEDLGFATLDWWRSMHDGRVFEYRDVKMRITARIREACDNLQVYDIPNQSGLKSIVVNAEVCVRGNDVSIPKIDVTARKGSLRVFVGYDLKERR